MKPGEEEGFYVVAKKDFGNIEMDCIEEEGILADPKFGEFQQGWKNVREAPNRSDPQHVGPSG